MKIPRVSTRVRKARADAVRRVNAVMQKSFGTRFEVTVFGSTLYGTDTADSDLDLVILDQKRPKMLSPTDDEELRGPYNLQAVAATLRRAKRRSVPMFINIETVGKAVVPIVKFKDTATRIYCDMNVNDRLGVLNTSLIMRYCILSPLVRPMMFVIKYWARHRGLNEPTGPQPAFNSYTLALMTIAFLQMRGLLPNIQSGHDGEYPDEDNYVWFRKVTRLTGEITHMKCDTFVRPMREFKPARDTPSLRQALVEWFDYWASEHDYSKTAVSVRDGGMIARMHIVTRHSSCPVTGDHLRPQALDEIAWDDGDVQMTRHREVATSNERMAFLRPPMCVHDPFIRLKNLTVAVSKQNVNQFKEGCAQASKLLQEGLPIQLLMSKRLAKCPVNIPTLEPSGGMSL
ncbi:hypothetical protein EVJ58_g7113 [Rhodofomes roseus]|uniref:Poly(A) RNA polymerase mitochondrial-like central palm domain-containing protein n=1 Tax=Rhodofomes roseus TaxID=34475 RepID=A0A4Y9Y4K2_9APHY|nr:hypothetical protein EVJ58_g7113 [Rhodofomes roseus]